jgi:hypothetical protein
MSHDRAIVSCDLAASDTAPAPVIIRCWQFRQGLVADDFQVERGADAPTQPPGAPSLADCIAEMLSSLAANDTAPLPP